MTLGKGGHQRLNGADTMDKTFPVIPRNVCTYHKNILGQQEYSVKWDNLK